MPTHHFPPCPTQPGDFIPESGLKLTARKLPFPRAGACWGHQGNKGRVIQVKELVRVKATQKQLPAVPAPKRMGLKSEARGYLKS